jgi:cyanophycinase
MTKAKGTLIIIGGREEKASDNDRRILGEVAKRAKRTKGDVVIIPVASQYPEEVAKEYVKVFHELSVPRISTLDIRCRDDATAPEAVQQVERASVVFFTGGDQLRITSQIGDSPVFQCLHKLYRSGATIVGTSAGAAAMPETMLIGGKGDESNRVSTLGMAPGLGLIEGVIIDSHFAERGRFGRLLGAVTENPRNVGIGIDENTAIVVEDGGFTVLGSGAVYILDGTQVKYSSLSERQPEGVVSIFGVKLHVLGEGDCFDLAERQPYPAKEAVTTAE